MGNLSLGIGDSLETWSFGEIYFSTWMYKDTQLILGSIKFNIILNKHRLHLPTMVKSLSLIFCELWLIVIFSLLIFKFRYNFSLAARLPFTAWHIPTTISSSPPFHAIQLACVRVGGALCTSAAARRSVELWFGRIVHSCAYCFRRSSDRGSAVKISSREEGSAVDPRPCL